MNYTTKFFELNPVNAPMIETDYYHWLSINWSGDRITDIVGYLVDRFGFIKGSDSIGQKAVQTHHYIHDQYFINEVK